jgi:VWFA-related protein
MYLPLRSLALVALLASPWTISRAQSDAPATPQEKPPDTLTFRTTVRRVLVDIVVRDSNNKPVHGLTARDFVVTEDGHPQNILSFDVHDFDAPSISIPANTPHPPPNHFVNIPATPEHGPLYVLLYDLVDIDINDQIDARRQILKFIKSKPAGTRFALFVRSDNLYLVQGFTDDKQLLYAALDPQSPKPHVPRVFLMGHNHGYGDPASMMNVLTQVTEFLDGVPGHKNLIWLAGTFPLALIPRKEDPREYEDAIIAEVNVLTRAQVAVYPINVGGVPVNPAGALTGATTHGGNANDTVQAGGQMSAAGPGINSLNNADSAGSISAIRAEGSGDSVLTDYEIQRTIARSTGGRAFFSTNDVTAALGEATDVGGNYYSLSYSPTNQKEDDHARAITIKIDHPGYQLSYRRYYFTGALAPQPVKASASEPVSAAVPSESDTLQPNMKHGAPMIHDLLFSAHVRTDGRPAQATAEQMSQLSDQPAYFHTRKHDKPLKPLAPIELQKYVIDYRVTSPTSQSQTGKPPSFEFAAAAFDDDSRMLNGIVNDATRDTATGQTSVSQEENNSRVFRILQQLDVPTNAAWIRIGVRDKLTNRMGTLEVQLPLAPEPPNPAVTSVH